MTKVYKATITIIDHENFDKSTVVQCIEDTVDPLWVTVEKIDDPIEVAWDDDHPLNSSVPYDDWIETVVVR